MTVARRFAERVATALVSFVATGMTTGGVALAGLGATLRQTGVDIEGMSVITTGLMSIGSIVAVTGGVGVISVRSAGYSSRSLDTTRRRPVRLLLASAALPVVLAMQLGSLIAYWRDIARLVDRYDIWESANGPAALVFMPAAGVLLVPALEAIAALTVVLSCAILVLLTMMRSTAVRQLSAVGALLVGGLCGGCWLGVAATERLVPGVETLIRTTPDPDSQEEARALALVARHRAVSSQSVWTLSWASVAMVLLAFGARSIAGSGGARPDAARAFEGVSLEGLDDRTRARALLDAADRLHHTTPPVRRF